MQRATVVGCCLALVLAVLHAGAVSGEEAAPVPGTVGQGLGNWASVLANVLVNREGGVDGAHAALNSFQQETRSQLKALVDALAAPGAAFPELPIIRDVAAFGNPFAVPSANSKEGASRKEGASFQQTEKPFTPLPITGASFSSIFFNYAPCLISQDVVGAAATAVGINIVPQVVNVFARGAQALPIGFNVNPAVILVNAQGAQAWPRGFNVQPTLIAVVPTGLAVVPKGFAVEPYGIAVTGK